LSCMSWLHILRHSSLPRARCDSVFHFNTLLMDEYAHASKGGYVNTRCGMKFDVRALDAALDDLNALAASSGEWNVALDRICKATASVSSVIVPIRSRTPGLVSTENMAPVLETYFQDEWHLRDFRVRGLPHLFRKGTMLEQDYATEEDFKNEGYYKFLSKYGLRWTAMAGFESGPEDTSCFVLYRRPTEDAYDREEEQLLAKARSHLSTASLISREVSKAKIWGMSEAFEMSNSAAIFFDRFGRVTLLNTTAERLIGQGIQISRGEVRCWRHADADALARRLRGVIDRAPFVAGIGEPVLISRQNLRPLVVRLQRLSGNLADVFSHSVAVALISDPETRPSTSPVSLMRLFKLTKTEAVLALDLVAGESPRDISEKRGLSYSTVRSHLRSLFEKTGTNRQSDLVSLIAAIRAG
jgi:DNA-binding CsgD family transcriptional regulator